MKNHKIIIAAIFILFSGTTLVYAQRAGVEWDGLNQQVFELYQQCEYSRALVVGQQALELAIKNAGPDHYDVATSLNNLASIYDTQGDYARAEPLYKRSLAIRKKRLVLSIPMWPIA